MSSRNIESLLRLEQSHGGPAAAARFVGVSAAVWSQWKRRGVPFDSGLRVWLALRFPAILARALVELDQGDAGVVAFINPKVSSAKPARPSRARQSVAASGPD